MEIQMSDGEPAQNHVESASSSPTELKLQIDAAIAARQQIESLVAEIQGRSATAATTTAEHVEQLRLAIERARAEIDKDLASASAASRDVVQEADKAKATIAELTAQAGTLHSTAKQAIDTSAQATATIESVRTLAATATDSSSRIEALKTQMEQAAQVAAQRSAHIEDGRQYVDKKRAEIDVLANTAQQSASSAEAQHQAARATNDNLTALATAASASKAKIDSDATSVSESLAACQSHAIATRALSDKADTTERRVAEYEQRLTELEAIAKERLLTIEHLLPGAASAGLASAFNQRRAHYKWPQRIWQGVFLGSVIGLLVVAGLEFSWFATSFPTSTQTSGGDSAITGPATTIASAPALTWDRLSLSLLHRLPFALPLIWLAVHAGHKAALAQRVEEDYAFKETVSRSFEGYRREMAELEGKATPNSPLARFCGGVLGVITNPPGRIYEKHPLNNTPLSVVADSAGPIATVATKVAKGTVG